ncbi:MAG: pilus assembly protein [Saezia sp.]
MTILSKQISQIMRCMGLSVFSLFLSASIAQAQSAPTGVINLSDRPLYLSTGETKPSLVLALSVEFPTVGAAYLGNTYIPTQEYLGYFNHNLCYAYDGTNRYFSPKKAVSSYTLGTVTYRYGCAGDGFSGNYMNFATASAIDTLRYSLTGGDRVIDTPTQTVLQRAVIRGGFYNANNFPRKVIAADHAAQVLPAAARKNQHGTTHNGPVYVSNCYEWAFFTADGGGRCDSNYVDNGTLGVSLTGTAKGFQVRAEVCPNSGSIQDDRTVGATGSKLCMQYPSGNSKPVGLLQRNASELRVAAFGYPFNNTYGDYAGILRAPMKYLGPVAYDSDYKQISGTNPKTEWDPTTGVFIADSENKGVPPGRVAGGGAISGVVNYLNQFGRTGQYGDYKTYDQATHLYYESLRYLQGMKPTSQAIAALNTPAAYDGFPAYATWEDPHPPITGLGTTGNYSCYENSILFIGDKNTHYENFIPGDGARPANLQANEPNFNDWTRIVNSFENNATSTTYRDGDDVLRHVGGNPSPYNFLGAVTMSKAYIAGLTYWANTHDIRGTNWTNQGNRTGSGDATRPGMRVKSYFIDVNEVGGSSSEAQRYAVQYYYAAKYGGFDRNKSLGGNPFLYRDGTNAGNRLWLRDGLGNFPNTYFLASDVQAVLTALENIFSNIISGSTNIGGVALSSGTNVGKVGDTLYLATIDASSWASDINQYTLVANGTRVVTVKSSTFSVANTLTMQNWHSRKIYTSNDGKTGVDFQWNKLDANYRNMLIAGHDAAVGEKRLDFIAGDRSREGSDFRIRSSLMGDVINSIVIYKGAPIRKGYRDYATFYEGNKNRNPVLYVGANDGMLHAFDVNSQKEIFAYIPNFIVPGLHELTSTTYQHKSYVDGQMDIKEVYANGWKTALVGAAGAGGQGVFALDVTSPNSANASQLLMWEFTDKDDAALGNVLGKLAIFSAKSPSASSHGEWFVAFSSGVNSQVDDGAKSIDGKPYIFVLNMNKGQATWQENVNYFKIPVGTAANPAAEIVNMNFVKMGGKFYVYAGDLAGQVWKVSLPAQMADWPAAPSSLLFKAQQGQAITIPLTISGGGGSTYVSFGTGKLLEQTDTQPAYKTQSLYTILDRNVKVNLNGLVKGTQQNNGTITIDSFTWKTNDPVNGKYGWYLDLKNSVNTGERIIHGMTLDKNGYLHVNSITPAIGHCDSGYSVAYQISVRRGTGAYKANDKLLGASFLVMLDPFHTVDSEGNPVDRNGSFIGSVGSDGDIDFEEGEPLDIHTGVTSMKEIPNYSNLYKLMNP